MILTRCLTSGPVLRKTVAFVRGEANEAAVGMTTPVAACSKVQPGQKGQ